MGKRKERWQENEQGATHREVARILCQSAGRNAQLQRDIPGSPSHYPLS